MLVEHLMDSKEPTEGFSQDKRWVCLAKDCLAQGQTRKTQDHVPDAIQMY